ncbi:hypothetical protein [Roseibacillus ishigakijimensis]|uniref:Uncharacterized protein n=1 Tax=Roseibacillus ishigakijimensis TaxID=454146 RepID=A0A934VLJ6_9BACT|nr:hypothetical protein [Roseibacillus ishigakijimensis]MBK1834754.1 hypothetical protein [Roseibacillus ishigakijimensis]
MRFFAILALSFLVVSCEKSAESKVEMFLDVYSDSKPGNVVISAEGQLDTSPVNVYLDGVLIGSTPLNFTSDDLERLNLPVYERVEVSPAEHWMTWDSKGDGTLVISHRDSPEEKRHLDFRSTDPENPEIKYFKGMATSRRHDGAIGLYPRFVQPDRAQQTTEAN